MFLDLQISDIPLHHSAPTAIHLNMRHYSLANNTVIAKTDDVVVKAKTERGYVQGQGPVSITTRYYYFPKSFSPALVDDDDKNGVLSLAGMAWEETTDNNQKVFNLADALEEANHLFFEKIGLKIVVCTKRFVEDNRNDEPHVSLVATGTDRSERVKYNGGIWISELARKRLNIACNDDVFWHAQAAYTARSYTDIRPDRSITASTVNQSLISKPKFRHADPELPAIEWQTAADDDDADDCFKFALDASENNEEADALADQFTDIMIND